MSSAIDSTDHPRSERSSVTRLRRKQPRIVLQSENSECGLACIAMIGNYHGYDIDLVSLRQRIPVSSLGVDFEDLVDAAGNLGLTSRALKAEIDETNDLTLPCILHWGTHHFVVLSKVTSKRFTILDPACGEREVSYKEFSRNFTGAVLELWPSETFREAKLRKRLQFTDLWSNIQGLWSSLAQIFLLSLFIHIFAVLAPLYTQSVVDFVIGRNQWDLLAPIAIGFALVAISQSAISFLRSYAILHLSNKLSVQMGANLFYHLVRLPLSYFIKRHLGDILSRFQSLHRVRQMMTMGIVSAWLDGFMTIITLAVMFYYSALLTGIVLLIVSLYVALRITFFNRIKQLKQEQLIAGAKENSHFMETMRAMQTLKIFQKENDRQSQWLNKLTNLVNKDVSISKWEAGFSAANSTLFGLENILVIFVCVILVRNQELTLGMLFAFIGLKANFTTSVNNLIRQIIDFKMLDIHFERISDIVFTEKEETDSGAFSRDRRKGHHGHKSHKEIEGRIDVENIAFRFEGAKDNVFQNISFSIPAGETAAIIGPSGCGKTTLIKCLMGLIAPTEGRILIDGTPLESLPFYRRQIAAVMQDDQLISGTIKDNITFFSHQASWERIYQSAKMAYIHEEVMNMPMQYSTLVGDLGGSLSGGQRQRIILARAIYRSPRILFMDEATSHLDIESEARVNQEVNRLSITRILVAHRPETVRAARKRIDMVDYC